MHCRNDENAQSDRDDLNSFIMWLTNHHLTRDSSIEVNEFFPDCKISKNLIVIVTDINCTLY